MIQRRLYCLSFFTLLSVIPLGAVETMLENASLLRLDTLPGEWSGAGDVGIQIVQQAPEGQVWYVLQIDLVGREWSEDDKSVVIKGASIRLTAGETELVAFGEIDHGFRLDDGRQESMALRRPRQEPVASKRFAWCYYGPPDLEQVRFTAGELLVDLTVEGGSLPDPVPVTVDIEQATMADELQRAVRAAGTSLTETIRPAAGRLLTVHATVTLSGSNVLNGSVPLAFIYNWDEIGLKTPAGAIVPQIGQGRSVKGWRRGSTVSNIIKDQIPYSFKLVWVFQVPADLTDFELVWDRKVVGAGRVTEP